MEMKAFTSRPTAERVTFKIDEEGFEALPANEMPGGVLDIYFKKIKEGEVFEAHLNFFKFCLTEESFKRFEDRYQNRGDHPITITMLGEIATWLLGSVYMGEDGDGDQEQPSSSGQPKKNGRGSTDGAVSKE